MEEKIWSTIAHAEKSILFGEVRSEQQKRVFFWAVDLPEKKLIFEHLSFEEEWWISIAEASQNVLLLKVYHDTSNPDKKSLIAYDFVQKKIVWWKNNFSITGLSSDLVIGNETGIGMKSLALRLDDGQPVSNVVIPDITQNKTTIKPLQYYVNTPYFDSVHIFLSSRFQLHAEHLIEYLEHKGVIIISCHVKENDLVNYLLVVSENGELLLKEKISASVTGIGVDTFFILSGFLIFVKNRNELVSYRIV